MLNAAQLLGSVRDIFLGARPEMFLCGADVWNLKNVFISALCVHEITSSLMEWYNNVLCGYMCWSSHDKPHCSLCKWHSPPSLAQTDIITPPADSFAGKIPASFPSWLRWLFTHEIWLGLDLRNWHLRNIGLVLWQSSHICATKCIGIHSSDPNHHGAKKKDQLNVYFMSLGWTTSKQNIRWSYNVKNISRLGYISMYACKR